MLADIDIDIDASFPAAATFLKEALPSGVSMARHKDAYWDILYATFQLDGQVIDLCDGPSTRIFDRRDGTWKAYPTDFSAGVKHMAHGRNVWVMPKKNLVEYKSMLGRDVDLEDVKALTG